MIDELAQGLGAPGSVVRSDEDVAKIREERVKQEQEARQVEAGMQLAQGLMSGQGEPSQAAGSPTGLTPDELAGL